MGFPTVVAIMHVVRVRNHFVDAIEPVNLILKLYCWTKGGMIEEFSDSNMVQYLAQHVDPLGHSVQDKISALNPFKDVELSMTCRMFHGVNITHAEVI